MLSILALCFAPVNSKAVTEDELSRIEEGLRNGSIETLLEIVGPCPYKIENLRFSELGEKLPILHFTVSIGSESAVRQLVDIGININLLDDFGNLAGEIAIRSKNWKIAEVLERSKLEFLDHTIFCYFTRVLGFPVSRVGDIVVKNRDVTDGNHNVVSWSLSDDRRSGKIEIFQYNDGLLSGKLVGILSENYGYFVFDLKDALIP